MNSPQTGYLQFLGSASVTGPDGTRLTGPSAQRHRLALLALLSIGGDRGLSREKLLGYLWPDRDTEPARQLLNQAVYNLRKTLGDEALLSVADDLRLNHELIRSDVLEFERERARGNHDAAVDLYHGPFLDGFFLPDAGAFDEWMERERERLAGAYARSLEALAESASAARDFGTAVECWRTRAALDPYDSRVAQRLMEALDATGNRAGALQHAAIHQRLLKDEFGTEAPAELLALADRLRALPASRPVEARDAPSGGPAVVPVHTASTARRLTLTWTKGVSYAVGAVALAAVAAGTLRDFPSMASPALSTTERARGRHTPNVAAHELYVRASDPARLRNDSAAREGLELFQQAIAIDSTYASAWAGMARMYSRVSGSLTPPERMRYRVLGREAARRAVALDDSLAEAHATLGVSLMLDFDFSAAERHLERAIELDPGVGITHEWMVTLYLWTGELAEAVSHAERALELNPLSPSAHAELARALAHSGRPDDALQHLDKLAGLKPPLLRAAGIRAHSYALQGRWSEAVETIRPQAAQRMWGLFGYLLARSGQREEALRVLARVTEQTRREGSGLFEVAMIKAGLGDLDEAVALLDSAITDRSLIGAPGPADVMIMGPLFEDLRRQAGFARVRSRLGLVAR